MKLKRIRTVVLCWAAITTFTWKVFYPLARRIRLSCRLRNNVNECAIDGEGNPVVFVYITTAVLFINSFLYISLIMDSPEIKIEMKLNQNRMKVYVL